MLRAQIEEELGQELFPCVGVLEGTKLSASFDGLTMDGKMVFESKTLNQGLFKLSNGACIVQADLPLHYRVQLEQQLLVSGADEALFVAGDLEDTGDIGERVDCVYQSDPKLRQRILDGWQQFEKDLANYEVKDQAAPVIGQTPQALNALPVLHIAASGQLLASNLDDFKYQVLKVLSSINTDLQTDQDFADAESTVKLCKQLESTLDKAKQSLYQQSGIALAIDGIHIMDEAAKSTRLALNKTIKHKKDRIKQRYIEVSKTRVRETIETLNESLPLCYEVQVPLSLTADLTAAIKGLKTLSSMQNALDSVVLKYESEASEAARRAHEEQALAEECGEAGWEEEGTPKIDPVQRLRENPHWMLEQPVSSSEAELAHLLAEQDEGISLEQINQAIYPLELTYRGLNAIEGLEQAVDKGDWPAVKQALIDHIEQAIPAAQ